MAKKRRRISAAIVTVLVLAITVSAVGLWHRSATASTVDSIIKLTDQDIDRNLSQYLNGSVIYKLPDTVKETDSISVIIQTKEASLLDAYEAGDRTLSFTEFVYSDEATSVEEKILAEKESLLASFDNKEIRYTVGADYKAIFGGFEVVIQASDFEALCKTLGDRATAIVGEEYNTCETQLVENKVNVYDTGIFDSSSFAYDGTGTVVAVLDTGLDYNHSAFSVDNFTADRSKLGMTYETVQALVSDTKASKLHAGLTGTKKSPLPLTMQTTIPTSIP